MILTDRIESFAQLGIEIGKILDNNYPDSLSPNAKKLKDLIDSVQDHNPWFTPDNVRTALSAIASQLTRKNLVTWTDRYPALKTAIPSKRIGVTMAGNIPLVGFHDYLSVLISGNVFAGKLSSKDDQLLPAISEILFEIHSGFKEAVIFETGHLSSIDAIIATGSDNAARYFEFYFSKYPNIIRKNRNGVAVIDGRESINELIGLGRDIFSYFGLGCRSVSKLYLPQRYNFNPLIESLKQFESLKNHQKYHNNYWYNRARFLTQQIPVNDTGFLLIKEDKEIASPPGVLFFEYYDTPEKLERTLSDEREKIQCIIGKNITLNTIDFGDSQNPKLWDYADNVDTIEFLISLNTSGQ